MKEEHIPTRRLFDSVSADLKGKFHFQEWELVHLSHCPECQHIRDIFSQQFSVMKKKAGTNEAA